MVITIIITIDPVKELELLNLAIHSLNLQTSDRFRVEADPLRPEP